MELENLKRISKFIRFLKSQNIVPITADGDHLITLPILRTIRDEEPLGSLQFDSHTDLFDSYFGRQKFTHGTPFRLAVEERLVDPNVLFNLVSVAQLITWKY